jgi:hypothetical protein
LLGAGFAEQYLNDFIRARPGAETPITLASQPERP